MGKEFAKRGDVNPHAEMYGERLREHLRSGLLGAIIGLVVILIIDICFTIFAINNGGINILEFSTTIVLFTIFGTIEFGLLFAGIPYGWRIISKALDRFTGRRIIVIDILLYIFLLVLRICVAIWIGFVAYPLVLAYYFIRSRKTNRGVKFWAVIIICAVVLFYAFLGIYAVVDAKSNAAEANETVAAVRTVAVDSFHDQDALVDRMCENALAITQQKENENVNELGWVVSDGSQLHGIYFMEAVDSKRPHYINRRLSLSNAVAVVTGYFLVEAGPILENQWEMNVRIYPNFCFDEDQVLTYDTDHVYEHSLRVTGMEELMEWFRGEYRDMNIMQMPSS